MNEIHKIKFQDFKTESLPVQGCCNCGIFLYVTVEGNFFLYDTNSCLNFQLPNSTTITSRISSFSISPSHNLVVAGFEDGSLLFYDIRNLSNFVYRKNDNMIDKIVNQKINEFLNIKVEAKIIKTLEKILNGKVNHISFVNDIEICTFDESLQLTYFTITDFSIIGITLMKKPLDSFNCFAHQIAIPPTNRTVIDYKENKANRNPEPLLEFNFDENVSEQEFEEMIKENAKKLVMKSIKDKMNFSKQSDLEKVQTFSYCYSPKFMHYIGLSLFNKFIIVEIFPNYKVIYEDCECENSLVSFSLPNPDLLYAAYFSKNKLTVVSLDKSRTEDPEIKKVYENSEFESPLRFISFLSPQILGLIYQDFSIHTISLHRDGHDVSVKLEDMQLSAKKEGMILSDYSNGVFIMSKSHLISYFLLPFEKLVSLLLSQNLIDKIIDLCISAINGEPFSCVGFTSDDPNVISSEIEQIVSINNSENQNILDAYFEGKDVKEVINLLMKMKNKNWACKKGIKIFESRSETDLIDFLTEMITADSDASNFLYDKNFSDIIFQHIDKLCQRIDILKIYHFINSLPQRVVNLLQFLSFTTTKLDITQASYIFSQKLQQPIHALDVLDSNNSNDIFKVISQNKTREVAEWLLARDENSNSFNRLREFLLHIEKPIDFQWLFNLYNDPSDLLNLCYALLITFKDANIQYNHPIFKIVEQLIIELSPEKMPNAALDYLLGSIFAPKDITARPDKREKLLYTLIKCKIINNHDFMKKILPLCVSHKFFRVEDVLLKELHLYGQLINNYLRKREISKVSKIISQHYNDDENSKDQIDEFLLENAFIISQLCYEHDRSANSRSLDGFLKVLWSVNCRILFSNNSLVESIESHDKNTQLWFVWRLCLILHSKQDLSKEENDFLVKWIPNITPFLATYFHDGLADIVVKYSSIAKDSPQILKVCEELELFDCCSLLAIQNQDVSSATKYIRLQIVKDSTGQNALPIYKSCVNLFSYLKSNEKENSGLINDTFRFLIDSFAIYLLEDIEKCKSILTALRLIFDAAESCLELKDMLKITQEEYAYRLGPYKFSEVTRVITGGRTFPQEFSVQANNYINNILDEKERGKLKLVCAKCGAKLFVDKGGTNILYCGHAVHNTSFCNIKTCPRCSSST